MSTPAPRPATYEDLLAVPAHLVAEIVNGQLRTHPRPRPRHLVASSALGAELGGPFQRGRGGPGGWWILDEPELHLGADVLVPDLAGWRRERMPEIPEASWFELAPDWVCEILSPSTARMDRVDKMAIYAREGVAHLWLIDPDLKTLEAFELTEKRWTVIATHGGDEPAHVAPFDAFALELGALWV